MAKKDGLAFALAEQVGDRISSGEWEVLAIAGGASLKATDSFLKDFEIERSDKTVVIVCERTK